MKELEDVNLCTFVCPSISQFMIQLDTCQ